MVQMDSADDAPVSLFCCCRCHLTQIILASDKIANYFKAKRLRRNALAAEAALAAVLAGKVTARGGVIGVMVSGGNADPAVFARALAAEHRRMAAAVKWGLNPPYLI